jgi:hypothetical protein
LALISSVPFKRRDSWPRTAQKRNLASSSSHPPYWGFWHPTGSQSVEPEKDYVTTIQVFGNPIDPTNRFFTGLKQLLKTADNRKQQEILISRIDCWLM